MKEKILKYGSFICLGVVFCVLAFLNLFYLDRWLDSDMAAEMIFSRQLAEEGHIFASPNWYYSTEFRFLYTQLVMGPLFCILDSWHIIRMVTNLVSYLLMTAAYFYMVKPLKLNRKWTVLTGIILLLPFSETMMLHMQMGNTYMPHVIISFFFFGMYLRLSMGQALGKVRKWELAVCYVLLAVVCGVSGVRYLLALQCPLLFASFLYLLKSEEFGLLREEFGRSVFLGAIWNKVLKSRRAVFLYYSILGLFSAVAGYGVNVAWVSRKYVFQTYESTNFIHIYRGVFSERVQNAFGTLIMLFGYIPDRGVLSLRGIVTLAAFVMLGIFVYCTVKAYKRTKEERFFVTLFLAVSFGLNVFVFIFTNSTMVSRYYLTILIFALPVVAFYMEEGGPKFDRLAVGAVLGMCLLLGSGKTVFSFLTVDKNEDKRAVAEFLEENDYNFGFATYWNANIITELTNGAVEVGNISNPEELIFFRWSSPMKYYEPGYRDGETFLLLTLEEAEEYSDAPAVLEGRQVYEDAHYVVYLYESTEALLLNGSGNS